MSYIYSFERLEIWQLARKLTGEVYRITQFFPESEKFGLTSQLRRGCISIASNIAEGNHRDSRKHRLVFTQIAFSSLMEVLNQLIIANDLSYITKEELNQVRNQIEHLGNKLNSYYNYQKSNIK